jgi:uncharacterized membrane protein YeaQ/YmgE (transglycosylase-associated protein family)
MNFFIWLLIGALAGFFAGNITKGSGFGIFGNILVGLIGSLLGGFIFGLFGIEDTNFIGSTVVATAGAVILLSLANLFRGKRV